MICETKRNVGIPNRWEMQFPEIRESSVSTTKLIKEAIEVKIRGARIGRICMDFHDPICVGDLSSIVCILLDKGPLSMRIGVEIFSNQKCMAKGYCLILR